VDEYCFSVKDQIQRELNDVMPYDLHLRMICPLSIPKGY
jgi:hypothetical protein